jgi:hypothetical protein
MMTSHSGSQAATAAPNRTASRFRTANAAMAPMTIGRPRWTCSQGHADQLALVADLGERDKQKCGRRPKIAMARVESRE